MLQHLLCKTVQNSPFTLLRRTAFVAVSVVGVSVFAASCGNDTLGVATTVVNVTPTNFATIPPVASTLPGTTTSLPANAVGTEQIYVVKAGDSPLAVANKYSISLTALLAYNGWVSPAEFPYPGSEIRIPPQAVLQTPDPTTTPSGGTTAPAGPASSGCGTRPAGTYVVQKNDSLWGIKEKFCVSMSSLLSANGWASAETAVVLLGQTIQIPAAGS